jgi:CheY-like chemotaxis protein
MLRESGVTPAAVMSMILVVDDDQQIRGWLRCVLEDKGYQVVEVGDGQDALAFIEQAEPALALIVLDLFMPNLDGPEVLCYLRANPRPVKILAISGHMINGYSLTQTAKVLGAHDALAKPFSSEEFLQRVEALLSHT